ncbi:MAG: glycosyltransferase involved in cell wall biosynthesis [Litorivivens sp.]|jgi:glycosyltransferase involved in cell wall biosynthesis
MTGYLPLISVSKKRILHITPWYPSTEHPHVAPWIRRHIEALDASEDSHILHIQAHAYHNEDIEERALGVTNIIKGKQGWPWRFTEILNRYILVQELKKIKATTNFDVVNFHIAYPHLVHLRKLKKHLPSKIVVTEHWSYYHYNFHSSKKLTRVKNIFKSDFKLICVSDQLRHDIERFCGYPITASIVPNIVVDEYIRPVVNDRPKKMVMGSYWKSPKRPELVLEAFVKFTEREPEWTLEIFGHGPQTDTLQAKYSHPNIVWLGSLEAGQIAERLREAQCFLMPSDYETFSVVTAEALCCGCAIGVSNKGALPELITAQNGQLVEHDQWIEALDSMTQKSWNHDQIAQDAQAKFNAQTVSQKYLEAIDK